MQTAQAFVSGASVFHTKNIVNGAMTLRWLAIQTMHRIQRHGLVGALENRRLVHIVPKTLDAHANEILVKRAPPLPARRTSELGKHAIPRPDFADVNRAIGIFYKMVAGQAFVIRLVAGEFGDVQVGDGDDLETIFAEVANHLFEVRKVFAIDGEGAVMILIINVEVNHIGGNFSLAEIASDFSHPRLRIITVTALLKSQRPERRQRRAAHQRGEIFHNLLGMRAVKEVVVQLAAIGAERIGVARFFAKIKVAAPGVIQKNSVTLAIFQRQKKRNGLVQRVGRFLPAKSIGVPIGESLVAMVERAGLIAQAKIMFVFGHGFPNAKGSTVVGHRFCGGILRYHFAG